jgi:hypothetical protein
LDELGEEYWLRGTIYADVLVDESRVTLRISGSDSVHIEPWQRLLGKSDSETLKFEEAEKIPLFVHGDYTDGELSQNTFTNSAFQTWADSHNLSLEVKAYIESRIQLLRTYRVIVSSDEEVLTLLFVSQEMRNLVEDYLHNWNKLLKAATKEKKLGQDDADRSRARPGPLHSPLRLDARRKLQTA